MCYSTQSSLTALTISGFIALYLIWRNRNYDRWNAAFIISVALIQLWEAGIWINGVNSSKNAIFLKLILITLFSQPLVQTSFAYYYTGAKILKYLSFVYIALLLYAVYSTFTDEFSVIQGERGHLVWQRGDSFFGSTLIVWLYLFGLFFGLLFGLPKSLLLLLVGVITFVWTGIKVDFGKEFASYWCYIAVAYSIVALIL